MKKNDRTGIKVLLWITISLLTTGSIYAKAPETKTAAGSNSVYLDYIGAHYRIAIQQQKKYNIPASITLAQAILESAAGQSYLALAGNNHFGIKCTDWKGLSVYKNDVDEYECFRKYLYEYSSFEDHSRFLKERSFYSPLFKLNPTDYKKWAEGLRKCGYATDSQYPTKLIRLIEDYQLYYYDTAGEDDPPLHLQKKATNAVKKTSGVGNTSPKTTATARSTPSKSSTVKK
ncbi:MAG: glucosaminidase domain-containing protein [Tannerella sp.]|jgi:flagellum-specific peptidoglycan hydrolase FlgJ|nr:glucosaminidase domain-containing protein [Tannerella sp.]